MGLIFSNIPELEGTNTEITLANLSSLEVSLAELFERRLAHLCELAHAIVSDGSDVDLIKSIILSIRSDGGIDSDEVCSDSTAELSALFASISVLERAFIFKHVFEMIPNAKYSFSDNNELPSPDSPGRIAYLQNSYNDTAFGHFSSVLRDAKASYYDSVNDICESVLSGNCQFCILPVETEKDGKLLSFYKTILKNELKINAEFDLYSSNGEGYTRYALLGRAPTLPPSRVIGKESNRSLEILYSDTDNISLAELMRVAELFGMKVRCVDTLALTDGAKNSFCMEFEATDADVQGFMTYLSVDCPEHLLIGLYQRN